MTICGFRVRRFFAQGSLLLVAGITVFIIWANHSALSAERFVLKRGALDPDRAFIVRFVHVQMETYADYDPAKEIEIYVARHDLNHDGQPELFVQIGHIAFCGVVGCTTTIFEMIDGEWEYIAALPVSRTGYEPHDEISVFVEDEPAPTEHAGR